MNAPKTRNENGTEFRILSRLNGPDPGGDGRTAAANLLSLGVPLAVLLAGLFFLHGSGASSVRLGKKAVKRQAAAVPAKHAANRPGNSLKQLQAKRPLPPDYSEKLVAQSEALARKKLLTQIQSFREMSRRMKDSRDAILTRNESRPLLPNGPADANDTSEARALPSVSDPGSLPENASVDKLYGLLREYEAEIQRNHIAESAARRALSRGLSFPEVYRSMKPGSTQMPSFDELIGRLSPDGGWAHSGESTAAEGLSVRSTAELNRYRELLGEAVLQAGLAASRLAGLFDGGRSVPKGLAGGSGLGGTGPGAGGGSGMGGSGNAPESFPLTAWSEYAGERLGKDMVKAQALPGRRFTRDAENRGWLYINTWYMIGPWENYGRDDYALVHPPELAIDLDAVYTDGQLGEGVEETDSDPIRVSGKKVRLDGVLRWKFMQSESMHNTVPVTTDHSTYYAYTELYFDRAVTMLVAIGTDDGGRVWINGRDVWQDAGTSWYNIDEHIEPFEFRQGWNTVLVRLENTGGSATGFSFMIIPADQVPPPKPDPK